MAQMKACDMLMKDCLKAPVVLHAGLVDEVLIVLESQKSPSSSSPGYFTKGIPVVEAFIRDIYRRLCFADPLVTSLVGQKVTKAEWCWLTWQIKVFNSKKRLSLASPSCNNAPLMDSPCVLWIFCFDLK